MTRLSLWGYELEVDEQATRAWYAQAEEWSCTCGHCRNFLVLARERKLPEEILHILDSLSIPVEKVGLWDRALVRFHTEHGACLRVSLCVSVSLSFYLCLSAPLVSSLSLK